MVHIIVGADLASQPGVTAPAADLELVAHRASDLVMETWANPTQQVPQWIKGLIIEVALRAHFNPKGLSSISRGWDDFSRTERFIESGEPPRGGIYLTDAEVAKLAGAPASRRRVGSIRLGVRL